MSSDAHKFNQYIPDFTHHTKIQNPERVRDILLGKIDATQVFSEQDEKEYEMLYLVDEVLHSNMLHTWTKIYDKDRAKQMRAEKVELTKR